MNGTKRKKIPSRYVIKMPEFLENFVLPYGEYNPDCDNINHESITELGLPNIKRIPNGAVTQDDLYAGRILFVEAGTKSSGRSICAYVRPSLVEEERKKGRKL